MEILKRNIANQHGENGKKWIHTLPDIIDKIAQEWHLSDINPVNNMSWNFVALATQNNHRPVVLKIGYDENVIRDEYTTLVEFNGNAAIKALNYHLKYHAILLEQAIPGNLLKDKHSFNIKDTLTIYAGIIKKLSSFKFSGTNHIHVNDWCKAIDKISDKRIPNHLIEMAKNVKRHLLSTVEHEYLCHGDLHLENIIQHGSDWLAIDPKGIIGEIAFEAAAFDLINKNEITDTSTISAKIIDRVTLLSTELQINYNRLLCWIFLRVMISVQWFIEDNGDPSQMLIMASYLYPLLDINTHE